MLEVLAKILGAAKKRGKSNEPLLEKRRRRRAGPGSLRRSWRTRTQSCRCPHTTQSVSFLLGSKETIVSTENDWHKGHDPRTGAETLYRVSSLALGQLRKTVRPLSRWKRGTGATTETLTGQRSGGEGKNQSSQR
jgi:hypothetical protein